MYNLLKTALDGLLRLFYPKWCWVCQNDLLPGETDVCLACQHQLPSTHFYRQPNNAVALRLRGRVPITAAASVYFFSKSSALQSLLHGLKYRNQPNLGVWLGRCMAHEATQTNWFDGVDVLVPVPLSKSKQRSRGYNQSACLAEGISQVLQIPMCTTVLLRHRNTATQTKKSRSERQRNVAGAFSVQNPQVLENKQVVLIDDVFTTGATLEACLETLHTIPGIQLRVLTLACAIE